MVTITEKKYEKLRHDVAEVGKAFYATGNSDFAIDPKNKCSTAGYVPTIDMMKGKNIEELLKLEEVLSYLLFYTEGYDEEDPEAEEWEYIFHSEPDNMSSEAFHKVRKYMEEILRKNLQITYDKQ